MIFKAYCPGFIRIYCSKAKTNEFQLIITFNKKANKDTRSSSDYVIIIFILTDIIFQDQGYGWVWGMASQPHKLDKSLVFSTISIISGNIEFKWWARGTRNITSRRVRGVGQNMMDRDRGEGGHDKRDFIIKTILQIK